MKSNIRFSALLIAIFLFCSALFPSLRALQADFTARNGYAHASDDHRPIRILFIGNSYTFVNNIPLLASALAAKESRPLETESVTEGGATLKLHWQKGDALRAIRQGPWDYVVLQEHSTLGPKAVVNGIAQINDPGDFYQYARLFDREIKRVGAKTIFYLTWARRNAPQNQAILTRTYTTIAVDLQAQIAPVGVAWANAMRANPDLVLHQEDLSHPNSTGSYLAACVFYSMIYHKSPVGLTSKIAQTGIDPKNAVNAKSSAKSSVQGETLLVNLSAPDAAFLQNVAWQTVTQQDNKPARIF
jgi:hypothetical protein